MIDFYALPPKLLGQAISTENEYEKMFEAGGTGDSIPGNFGTPSEDKHQIRKEEDGLQTNGFGMFWSSNVGFVVHWMMSISKVPSKPCTVSQPLLSQAKFVKASEAVNMDVAAFKFLQACCTWQSVGQNPYAVGYFLFFV